MGNKTDLSRHPHLFIKTMKNPWDIQVGGGHYKNRIIQPTYFCIVNNVPYAEGCVIKYVMRWRDKNGVQDLEKAKHYLELLIYENSKK